MTVVAAVVTVVVGVGTAETAVVIVDGVVVDVRHGVFITSRKTGGIDVDLVELDADETIFVSAIDVIGSGTIVAVVICVTVVIVGVVTDGEETVETGVATRIGAAATTGVVVDPPLATSSITSSM